MVRKIIFSPVVVFSFLGMILYFVYTQFNVASEDIIISEQTIESLIQQNQELSQQPLSEQEKQELIQSFIDDEVLIREARKSGIDQTDSRMRKRMLLVMRSTLTEQVPDPTYSQLQVFYEESIDRYKSDSARSFIHVFFEFTNDNIPELNEETVSILNSTNDPGELGDFFMSGNRFPEYSFKQTASVFGRPFSEQVFQSDINQWIGPVESMFGKHFIYVFDIHEPRVPPFEEVERFLKQDYIFQKTRENQQEKIEEIKKNYNIVIEN